MSVTGIFKVRNRSGIVFYPNLHTAGTAHLIGVHRGLEAKFPTGCKYSVTLLFREESLFAKDIYVFGKPFGCHSRYHLIYYLTDIPFMIVTEPLRESVCPHKGRFHRKRRFFSDTPYNSQHFDLIFRSETIAALDLYCAGTEVHNLFHPHHCLTEKFLFRRLVK